MLKIVYVQHPDGTTEEWENATPIVMHDAGNMLRIESADGKRIYAYYTAWASVWTSDKTPRGFQIDEPVSLPALPNTLGDGHDHQLTIRGVCVLCGAFAA